MDVLDILERPLDQGNGAHEPPDGSKVAVGATTQESYQKNRPSRWKQKRAQATGSTEIDTVTTKTGPDENKAKQNDGSSVGQKAFSNTRSQMFGSDLSTEEQIHLDNLQQMAAMDPTEIEKEKQALIGSMNADVLQALLRRAEIKEQEMNVSEPSGTESIKRDTTRHHTETEPQRVPDFISNFSKESDQTLGENGSGVTGEVAAAACDGVDSENSNRSVHFLRPAGSLEPETYPGGDDLSGNDFLTQMHMKYFPELPVEHDKLAWMKPISQKEAEEYTPDQDSLAPSEIRFDFNGDILGPQRSREIDTGAGLHHHGDAPMAAGYTIGELGRLARSVNVSQRCLAVRTLGRVLYKLAQIKSSELRAGLQGCIDQNRIIESLYAANSESNSLTLQAYATEALWNYHQSNSRTAV